MKVLSLFDGCSGARQALDNLGIECEYYASEVDKYAIEIANKNYPDTIQLGDVTKLNESNLPKDIDLMIGGFPCTSLSCAAGQKESGLDAGESMLFWEFVRILKIVKPKFLIGENVASMKDYDRDRISNILNCSPIYINSAKITAQNRQRYYWCNFHVDSIPEKIVVLKDILEPEVDKKYFLNETQYPKITWKKSGNNVGFLSEHQGDRIIDTEGKSNCLSANGGNNSGGGCNLIAYIGKGKQGQRIFDNNGKSPALIASNQELYLDPKQIGHFGKGGQGERVYDTNGKSVNLVANAGGGGAKTGYYKVDHIVRRLTPVECEKLQGMKPNYTAGVSDTQRYKMIGNGFTIPVIEWLIKNALKYGNNSNSLGIQCSLL